MWYYVFFDGINRFMLSKQKARHNMWTGEETGGVEEGKNLPPQLKKLPLYQIDARMY